MVFRSLAVVLASVAVACSGLGTEAEAKDCPEALVVLPGAREVDCGVYTGPHQVRYFLAQRYPADEAIAAITDRLESTDWVAVDYDFLNPELGSSGVRKWQQFIDATTEPHETVRQWMGDWEHENGSVVRYGLRYTHPRTGPTNNNELQVFGMLLSKELVEQVSWFERQ